VGENIKQPKIVERHLIKISSHNIKQRNTGTSKMRDEDPIYNGTNASM